MVKCFGYEGAIGLGIVAAMSDGEECSHGGAATAIIPRAPPRRRSDPIPILLARSRDFAIRPRDGTMELDEEYDDEEEMMSESYTCVITHVGGAAVKEVQDDDGSGDFWDYCAEALFNSPPPMRPPAADFLSRCFRCSKKLNGIDIFIYGGEKAFCSDECRRWEITSEERGKRNRLLDTPAAALDCAASPCSTPMAFRAGVAAA